MKLIIVRNARRSLVDLIVNHPINTIGRKKNKNSMLLNNIYNDYRSSDISASNDFIINVLLVVFLIFIVGFLIKMIFPSYIDIIYLSQIAFISGIFIFPSTVLNTFLDAKRKFVDLTKVVLSVSILKFLGFLILIPWFGLLGAIIVIILDDIIQFIILFYLVFKNNFKN